jgi:hypothetical protein
MPWQVPAFDSYVRKSFRIGEPENWQRNRDTYRLITRRIFEDVRDVAAEDPGWLGSIEPKTLVRGFDKYHWWRGGGSENNEKVRTPWYIASDLGLDCQLSDSPPAGPGDSLNRAFEVNAVTANDAMHRTGPREPPLSQLHP